MHKFHIFIRFYLFLSILSRFTSSSPLTLPLNSTQGLNFYGPGAFSQSEARAGDINGDGIDDIVIGSPYESGGAGIVYVIYGSKSGLTDLTYSNLATLSTDGRGFQIKGLTNSQLGASVSCAGDVNGDGIEDLIMGAPVYNSYSGYAYVMFGKKTGLRDLDLTTDASSSALGFEIIGPSSSYFGSSVSGIGDVNGDGIDDIIIGAPYWAPTPGTAYIIYGKKTGLAIMTLTASTDLVTPNTGLRITGVASSDLGISVSGVGDVNGDGVNDIVVGGFYYNSGNGYAAVIFGSKSQLSDINVVPGTPLSSGGCIIISPALSYFGFSVSRAGDVNGDGLADIIIGGKYACLTGPPVTYAGAVFVIYGSKTWSSQIYISSTWTISPSLGFSITSGGIYSFLGHFVSSAGDFNGDGVDDIIIGASGDPTQSVNGAVYVIYGNKTGLANIDRITPTSFVDPSKGFVISPIYAPYSASWGDFNGDLGPDLLFGAQNNITTQGATYLLLGTSRLSASENASEKAVSNSMIQILAAGAKAMDAAVLSISIINFSNPLAAILKSISDSISFIKYLNITYPPKVQDFLDNYQSGDLITFDGLSSAPQALVDAMNNYPLPAKLEKYEDSDGFYSSFLINFWPSLITLFAILIFVPIAALFKLCTRSSSSNKSKIRKFIQWICEQLSRSVKWNLMLSKFSNYYGSISLFTFIEIRTTRVSSVLEVLSLCICGFVTLGLLLAQIRMILVVYNLQKAKQKNNIKILEDTKEDLKDYEVVFESFKDGSFFQQSFLFFYNLRIYIFYAIISWFDFPLGQTLLNSFMGVIIFLYLAISRPVKSKLELIQYIVIELIFLVVNICTLGLAALEFYGFDNQQSRIGLGDVILFCNNALMYCTLFILFLSILFIVGDVVKVIRQKWFKPKRIPNIKHRSSMNTHTSNTENDNDTTAIELNSNNNSQFVSLNSSNNNKSRTRIYPPSNRVNRFGNPRYEGEFHNETEEGFETSKSKY